jgi:hypothetical protein
MRSSKKLLLFVSVILIGIVILPGCANQTAEAPSGSTLKPSESKTANNLAVLWTSGDPAVAHKVCFMYTHNAKKQGWFGRVQLIVWGPSSKLLAEDSEVQAAVKTMMADGVEVKACKACADSYGVSDKLASLGIEVKYMGMPLTNILKSAQWEVLTF